MAGGEGIQGTERTVITIQSGLGNVRARLPGNRVTVGECRDDWALRGLGHVDLSVHNSKLASKQRRPSY